MNYLLDTNVVSEFPKPRPNEGVVSWLAKINEDRVFISVVTIAELRHGIERLPLGKRRRLLDEWMRNELCDRFDGRILNIDTEVANACGTLLARSEATGRSMEVGDAFVAASAEVHGLSLVTRNVAHFEKVLKNIISPWS